VIGVAEDEIIPGDDDDKPGKGHGVDRRKAPEKALVVVPVRPDGSRSARRDGADEPDVRRSVPARVEEAVGLARAIDLVVVGQVVARLNEIRPATLIGQGKVAEIGVEVKEKGVGLVVVDHPLSPIQQRNLEKAWETKVVDRTGLILEIFGDRARTKEGRLQVELAHLTYQKSRLVRSWTHLERQRGGFGFLGGPGETQIEADRRVITDRIARIERELETVRRTRDLQRKTRKKVPHPIVALVGYTNAGKSTLFNRLSGADVFAENLLFATLDPTLRKVKLPHGGDVILSDTVGFVSDLPTHLVAAFRATLEEVLEADLILHVRDIAHEDTRAQAKDVVDVLAILGLNARDPARVIEVLNKIDRLPDDERDRLAAAPTAAAGDDPERIAVSALSGEGIERLIARIEERLNKDRASFDLSVPASEGALVAWIYRVAEVLARKDLKTGKVKLTVRVPDKVLGEFRAKAGPYLVRPKGATPTA
jgi:GTP-binding protein HflX